MRRNLGSAVVPCSSEPALFDLSEESPASLSLDEVSARADAFASAMIARGIGPGSRVGICGQNSANLLCALLGAMRSGGVAVPLNHKLPNETLEFISADARLELVLADGDLQERFPSSVPANTLTDPVPDGSDIVAVQPAPGQAAMVLYTSGSTGRPKGVLLSHDSQWTMLDRLAIPQGVTGIVAAPLYHMNGLLFALSLLHARSRLVLMPRFEASAYLRAVDKYRVNVVTGVPTMLAMMSREREDLGDLDLESVSLVSIGSAPLTQNVIRETERLFPNARVANGYGTTETGAGVFGRHPDGLRVPKMSLGYPAEDVEVRLSGGTADEGVLQVRTPSAMTEYLNSPQKTAEKVSPDGWIDTGDVMRRDEHGFYYFVGRADDMFVCGGENVYPGQLERVLERHPAIEEVCVVPVPDEVRGEMPVAFITLSDGHSLTEDEVKELALAGAPAYMHPRRVFFVDGMPLAATNKIDRRALTKAATGRLS